MKKFVGSIVSILFFCFGTSAQEDKYDYGGLDGPCPPGMCVVKAGLVIDVLNFHKPKTDCKTGFGLCLKMHVNYECGYPPYCISPVSVRQESTVRLENNKVFGWVEILPEKAIFHFPLDILTHPEFRAVDTRYFHVGGDMIFFQASNGKTWHRVKEGSYLVKKTEKDLEVAVLYDNKP